MYHFKDTKLWVVKEMTDHEENAAELQNARAVILGHVLPTTKEFIRLLLDAGMDIHTLIAKPYSVNGPVFEQLEDMGVNIVKKPYETLDETDFLLDLLESACTRSADDGRQIVLFDIGGYFARPLGKLDPSAAQHIVGVVEDTTFGHNRYLTALTLSDPFPVPIYSVARSDLKEIEARFVGRDAVQAADKMLRDVGITMTGRNALVIGYGMIGRNVARTLRNYDLNVYVYDLEDRKLARAFVDGFHIHTKKALIPQADIIFSATGSEALHGRSAMSLEDIQECKSNAILASVGSRASEFDIAAMERASSSKRDLGEYLTEYSVMSKPVIVANHGTAVNFILPSIPVEVLDLVFAEMLQCALCLLKAPTESSPCAPTGLAAGRIHILPSVALDRIAKSWNRRVNIEA